MRINKRKGIYFLLQVFRDQEKAQLQKNQKRFRKSLWTYYFITWR